MPGEDGVTGDTFGDGTQRSPETFDPYWVAGIGDFLKLLGWTSGDDVSARLQVHLQGCGSPLVRAALALS